jgi:hypothetical protein
MGRVFTWDEVLRKEVPTPDDFRFARSALELRFLGESSILYVLLFGSVVRGDQNCRSDFDCLVVYDAAREEEAMRALADARRVANQNFVVPNILPVDSVLARSRFHSFGPTLTRHFNTCVKLGGVLKGKGTIELPEFSTVREDVENYLRRKLRRFVESRSRLDELDEKETAHFLQKLLEFPVHIARKMLELSGEAGDDDSKKIVFERYSASVVPDLRQMFERLLELDVLYTKELGRQLAKPNELDYQMMVATILEEAMSLATQFVRENIARMET